MSVIASGSACFGPAPDDTSPAQLDDTVAAASVAAEALVARGRHGRAEMLRAMAASLEAHREQLVGVADAETHLGSTRLHQELTRTRHQLELFADVLIDGAYLESIIDRRADTPAGPRPDLRRMLHPLGPVAVFGASNFPFAFSVPGGDTASALAAGCPVIAKVHEAHPATSHAAARALAEGAEAVEMPHGVISLIHGRAAATQLVRHPVVRAVGFTGSLPVGRMLADIAASRPEPIPFYGELGALNVVAVCRAAARARGAEIGRGLATSFTLGLGQYCTKPGLVFAPAGSDGDALRESVTEAVSATPGGVMLSEKIASAYEAGSLAMEHHVGVEVLARGGAEPPGPRTGKPLVLRVAVEALEGQLLEECFGPVMLVVDYETDSDLERLLDQSSSALTGTVHADADDASVARTALTLLSQRVGRVVWNGYPTGVAVAWGTHHGGPYPATTSVLHTSVGATAIRRWLRPVSFQDLPQDLLPDELRDQPSTSLPRRVDGQLTLSN